MTDIRDSDGVRPGRPTIFDVAEKYKAEGIPIRF